MQKPIIASRIFWLACLENLNKYLKLRCKRSVLKAVSLSKSQLRVQEPSAYADLLDQRREEEAAVYWSQLWQSSWSRVHNPPWYEVHVFCVFFCLGVGWSGGWGGDDDVPCTCTHGQCYASHGLGWGVGMTTFLALAHTVNATQVMGWGGGWGWRRSLHLHTRSMLRKSWGGWADDVPCTSNFDLARIFDTTQQMDGRCTLI